MKILHQDINKRKESGSGKTMAANAIANIQKHRSLVNNGNI